MARWFRERWRGAAVAAVAVAMTAGLVAGSVMAQTPATPTPGTGMTQERPGPLATTSDFLARLASKLGLDAARVQTAAKDAQTELIDEAVAAGRLSAEAATRLKERVNAGDLVVGKGGPGGHGGRGGMGRGGLGVDHQALATWLSITPEQPRTESAGKSMTQVAQAHGKTRDALIAFLTDQVKATLSQAVTDGRVTQQQADERLAHFQQNVGQMVDQVRPAGGPNGTPGGPRAPRATTTPGTNA